MPNVMEKLDASLVKMLYPGANQNCPIRCLIRTEGDLETLRNAVIRHGGTNIKDIPIIRAVVAVIHVDKILTLAQEPSVKSMEADTVYGF